MNRHSNNTNALLVEIMLAVLFFSICAATLLQAFTAVHTRSDAAGREIDAMIRARNIVEQLNTADDPASLLMREGFEQEDGRWVLMAPDTDFIVTLGKEDYPGGALLIGELTALDRDLSAMFTLRSAHYVPEVAK